jgi:acid phosphatase type 7
MSLANVQAGKTANNSEIDSCSRKRYSIRTNMMRPILVSLICLLVVGFSADLPVLRAAGLRRGPYLQVATPGSIALRWRTDVACQSVVRYGTQSNLLTSCTSDLNSTTEHEVRLTGLTPATQYFYSVGSLTNVLVEGPDCHFITPPPPGQAKPTRVWIIGDAGQGTVDGQVRVRNAYYQYTGPRCTDVWLALGDNADPWGTDSNYQTCFFDAYPEMFRQTTIWSAIGNHETFAYLFDGRFTYLDIFSFPTNGETGGVASGTETYYSFDYANIHFICLDSATQSRAPDGPMANWLRTDLDSTTNDWLIAFWHHPPYTKGWHDSDTETELIEMRQNIVPILEARGVDLVISGHSHRYERSYLLRGHYGDSTTLQPEMILDQGSGRENDTGAYVKPASGPGKNQGTVYIEAGCASVIYGPGFGHHPAMFFDDEQLGSVALDIDHNRLDAAFLRDSGAIGDSFTMIKGDPEPLRLCFLTLKDGKVILCWKSLRDRSYQIEDSEYGQPLNWQPASDPITAIGATTSWTNALSPGPLHLYRVVELPLPQTAKMTGEPDAR